ncbi:hypothetical protein HK104_009488 [Borealophlyctis nickersoniae]|nr:hypothetical protein HK104_009488 [Borealophlyctis nickersoniae]
MTHQGTPSTQEILGAYEALNTFAGIPKQQITGFRHPFLLYNDESLANIQSTRLFQYDSSMPLSYLQAGYWPYTLDNGPVATCTAGTCSPQFRFPGLWEIPLYSLVNEDGTENATMDPDPVPGGAVGIPTKDEIVRVLKHNFLTHYNGGRLPFGIYLHAAIAVTQPQRVTALREFAGWIVGSGYRDVYWVTNQQLLKWMANPTDVDGSLKNPALDCLMPATAQGNKEICDGVDNDGNGQIDEGLVSVSFCMDLSVGDHERFFR